jgi:hypothetical protein
MLFVVRLASSIYGSDFSSVIAGDLVLKMTTFEISCGRAEIEPLLVE